MYYKYLTPDGFYKSIENKTIMFTNLNTWHRGEGNDPKENFLADCIEDEESFNRMMKLFSKMNLSDEDIFKQMYILCLLSYETYASCFTKNVDNQKYMWDEYTKEGGVCVIYDEAIYRQLESLYGQKNNKIGYSFVVDEVDYCSQLQSIENVIQNLTDINQYRELAFLKKHIKFQKEEETRFLITRNNYYANMVNLTLLPFVKDYNKSFHDVREFIAKKMGIEIDNTTPVFLDYVDSSLINGIYLSPNNNKELNNEIIKFAEENMISVS